MGEGREGGTVAMTFQVTVITVITASILCNSPVSEHDFAGGLFFPPAPVFVSLCPQLANCVSDPFRVGAGE